jgi:hypothetical protein
VRERLAGLLVDDHERGDFVVEEEAVGRVGRFERYGESKGGYGVRGLDGAGEERWREEENRKGSQQQ